MYARNDSRISSSQTSTTSTYNNDIKDVAFKQGCRIPRLYTNRKCSRERNDKMIKTNGNDGNKFTLPNCK